MNIYEINSEYMDIIADLETSLSSDQLDLSEIETLNKRLEINAAEFKEKTEAYSVVISQKKARAEYLKAESKRLADMAKSELAAAEKLSARIAAAMIEQGMKKVETNHFKLSFRKSESVQILDQSKIPADFFVETTTSTLSKSALKTALKSGPVDGAELVSKQNLQIK
mgnify:CR=1 FL=1